MKLRVLSAAAALLVSVLALRPAAEPAVARPEDVGLSSERLARITEMMKRHIAAGEISGGVKLGNVLVIGLVVLKAGDSQKRECGNNDDGSDNELDLFAFHRFNPCKNLSTL